MVRCGLHRGCFHFTVNLLTVHQPIRADGVISTFLNPSLTTFEAFKSFINGGTNRCALIHVKVQTFLIFNKVFSVLLSCSIVQLTKPSTFVEVERLTVFLQTAISSTDDMIGHSFVLVHKVLEDHVFSTEELVFQLTTLTAKPFRHHRWRKPPNCHEIEDRENSQSHIESELTTFTFQNKGKSKTVYQQSVLSS